MKYQLLLVSLVLALSGCATHADRDFYNAQKDVETAKWTAVTAIANGADPTTRAILAAMVGAGMSGGGQGGVKQAAPDTTALQWASVLVPGAVQAYNIVESGKTARFQSTNSTTLGISNNNTMYGIAGLIQAQGSVTNNDNHSVVTPAPVVITPVVPAPVITPIVQIVPVTGK